MFGLSFGLLSGVPQYLGELYEFQASEHIDKDMLSLYFKDKGNP